MLGVEVDFRGDLVEVNFVNVFHLERSFAAGAHFSGSIGPGFDN